MSRGMYAQLREVGKLLRLDCGDNSCSFAEKRGGMRTNGGCRCDLTEAVNRALEPASPQGEWTKEAPTEAGWYWVDHEPYGFCTPGQFDPANGIGWAQPHWSVRIELPPPPTEGSER